MAMAERSAGSVGPRDEADGRRAGFREWLALGVLVLAVLLLAVDGTVLSLAVPALSAALNPSATQLLWIGDVYSFALAGLLVTMGSLADRVGRKRLLLIGAAGFGLASLLAAFAPTAGWLIIARALLGVAGATLMPSTLAIIRNLFTDARQRTTAIAVWVTAAVAGAAVGPLVGGALLEHFWWGSVFLLNLPVMVVLVVAGAVLLPESRDPHPGAFDLPSALLTVLTVVPLVYAVKQAAIEGIGVAAVLAAVAGLAAGVAFVRRQRRLAVPLFDLGLFRVPAFTGAVVANMLSIGALSGLLFFLSQYLQLVRGYGPLEAGLRQLPLTLASVAVTFLVGRIAARVGPGRTIGVGLLLSAAGLALLAAAEAASGYALLAAAMAAVGLGAGAAMTVTSDAVLSAVPPARAGAASAVSETAYELGVALGIALLGSLHTALYQHALVLPPGVPEEGGARGSLADAVALLPHLPPAAAEALLVAARSAFTRAMEVTSLVAAVLLAVAGALAWWMIPSRGDVDGARPAGDDRAGAGS
jgi:DHA2 family multidrug resistance protein-like MFS transporter